MSDAGAAVLIEDKDLEKTKLKELIKELSENPLKLSEMEKNAEALGKTNAADVILGHIIDLLKL